MGVNTDVRHQRALVAVVQIVIRSGESVFGKDCERSRNIGQHASLRAHESDGPRRQFGEIGWRQVIGIGNLPQWQLGHSAMIETADALHHPVAQRVPASYGRLSRTSAPARLPTLHCPPAARKKYPARPRGTAICRRRLAASPGGLPPEGALAALHVRAGGTTTSPDARLANTPSGGNASRRLNGNRP